VRVRCALSLAYKVPCSNCSIRFSSVIFVCAVAVAIHALPAMYTTHYAYHCVTRTQYYNTAIHRFLPAIREEAGTMIAQALQQDDDTGAAWPVEVVSIDPLDIR
jgi:hypothetical protein